MAASTESTSLMPENYVVPREYQEVEFSTDDYLVDEDLNENKELWLVRLHDKIPLEKLNGTKLKLKKESTVEIKSQKIKYKVETTSESTLSAVIPSIRKRELIASKIDVTGQIEIVPTPSCSNYHSENDSEEIEEETLPLPPKEIFKQRYTAYGSECKRKVDDDDKDESNINKKKKHKKEKKSKKNKL